MLRFDKNEKKDVWIEVQERDGGTVTVASATFEVFDADGDSVQASASASIANNSSTAVKIYGLVDTTASGFASGSAYEVKFTYVIGNETYIDVVPIKLVETKL